MSEATDVVEAEATEIEEVRTEPAREQHAIVPVAPPQLAVTPQVKAAELVERLGVIRDAAENAMKEGVDFGEIPGTDKPTLLKPGAEKLGVLFQLDVQLANDKTWGPGDHLTVVSHATVFHAPSGARLGYGEGVCTTRERKYAYRQAQLVCPSCGEQAVIKGKDEYGGGWLCWKKRNGCGAKWPDGDKAIEGQERGEVENPDLPDLWNTVVKMAEKRARVDAVLAVTGASALFTQDIEDSPEAAGGAPRQQANAAPADEPAAAIDDLPEERVVALGKAIGHIGLGFERLCVLFGAADAERPKINRSDSIRVALRSLTAEQADRLEGLFQKEADRG